MNTVWETHNKRLRVKFRCRRVKQPPIARLGPEARFQLTTNGQEVAGEPAGALAFVKESRSLAGASGN